MPEPTRFNLRSVDYFLLIGHRACWRCKIDTGVFGFALPNGHEALEYSDGEAEPTWVRQQGTEVVLYATHIGDGALARMATLTSRYRKDYSATTGTLYFMNHCERCDAKLGDFDTIDEFDAPLTPLDPPSPDRLTIIPVDAHFEAAADTTPLPFASS